MTMMTMMMVATVFSPSGTKLFIFSVFSPFLTGGCEAPHKNSPGGGRSQARTTKAVNGAG